MDEEGPSYGFRVSRAERFVNLEASYALMSRDMFAFALTRSPTTSVVSPNLAEATLRSHFATLNVVVPIVAESGRSFSLLGGGGLALFVPHDYRILSTNPDEEVSHQVPEDLDPIIDPLVTGGASLSLPLSDVQVRFDAVYIFQFCEREDSIRKRYLCSRDTVLDHFELRAGITIPVSYPD